MSQKKVAEKGTSIRYEMMELAKTLPDVIALGRGDPDQDTPAHIVQAAKDALRRGAALQPAPAEGLFELRQAIADKLRRENNVLVDPATEVLVTGGGQEALFFLIQSLLNPGDEVLVPDPRYTSYDAAIHVAGGKIVPVPTYQEDSFDLRPEEVEKRIGPKSKVLLLVTPGNPTSGVISPKSIRRLAEIAQERNLIVISDEIYEKFIYDDAQHMSIASLPGMKERTITLNGVSKTYAMTGWRVGYVAAPASIIAAMRAMKISANRGTSVISQWGAHAAFTGPQDCVERFRRIYDERRQIMMQGLDEMGFTYGRPKGAFYAFPDASSVGISAEELSYLFLKEGRVLIFPGNAFGESGGQYLRISLLAPKERLQEAVARMKRTIAEHVKK
ncbi:MAG: pyridoxal phosphate-dependent aminotransferase [Chloroflexi bacterium]|nr:pyridoxal phosphate-dependent aminotransferase [Chloroflexota bacterium]